MNILGIMSGSSLDGLDLAVCSFMREKKSWSWDILSARTTPYSEKWTGKLRMAPHLPGMDLQYLHQEYGQFIAREAGTFLGSSGFEVEMIASHGHTVFHQPEASFTFQVGDPQVIAAETGIRTAGDFRRLDVQLGGQGAPLVPAGDEHLFSQYDYCLNLGGFANISFRHSGKRLARDICPANIILNQLSRELEMPYDNDGHAGRSGTISGELLDRLNALPFYRLTGPASLGREWLETEFLPCLDGFSLPVTDVMRTVYEHIALQVSGSIEKDSSVLLTGGGAHNSFLVELIRSHSQSEIILPDPLLVDFKEALVFAFLGLLRDRNEVNCFASVTGAVCDSSCGVIYNPS